MRRLLRWTFHALAAASLLLCLATAGLWVRSYWACDQFIAERKEASSYGRRHGTPHRQCVVLSCRGRFTGWLAWSDRPEEDPTPPWVFELEHPIGYYAETLIHFATGARRDTYEGYAYNTLTWSVPAWVIVCASTVLPGAVAIRRRRRRARLGCCPACGYDLRATPGRCPECGRQGDKVKG